MTTAHADQRSDAQAHVQTSSTTFGLQVQRNLYRLAASTSDLRFWFRVHTINAKQLVSWVHI
jgi:hypothetical protein